MSKAKENKKVGKLTKDEEQDASMAAAMGSIALSDDQARQAIDKMVGAADPTLAVGQVVANAILKLKEQSDKQGMPLGNKIWMAEGGVADRLVDTVVQDLDARTGNDLSEQKGKIWLEVLNIMKLASKAGTQQQQPQQGAPMPQQGPAPGPQGPQPGVPMGPLGGM